MRRLILAFVGLWLAAATSAHAGGCETAVDLANDVWTAFKTAAYKVGCPAVGDTFQRFFTCSATKISTGLAQNMLGWWNNAVQNQWATIGPRRLGPEWQEGTLPGTGGRTFITLAPLYSKTTVELEKLGGSSQASLTICSFDESGRFQTQHEVDIASGQANTGKTWPLNVDAAEGKLLVVKLDGKSLTNRFQYRIRTVSEPVQWYFGPIEDGFADLHVHQAAELAHGGNVYWGSHKGRSSEALEACQRLHLVDDTLRILHGQESVGLHGLPIDVKPGIDGALRHGHGHPNFEDWPHYTDFGHQQVHTDWLKQAHQRGLKLMVVSAVNNEPLCRLLKLIYPDRNRQHTCDDMYNIKRQIQAFHDFQKTHTDWYEIAVHPWHARKIINEKKLAVVISVETSNLFGKFPTSAGDFSTQLDDLYALGVRTLQPVHETDSRFAGAAPHRLQFELFQAVKWPTRVIEDLARGTFGGFAYSAGKNSVGMRPDGARLVDLMVQRRMLIDVAHMSEQAFDDYYAYVMSRYDGYPLYNSHVRFEALLNQKMRHHLRELVTPERQLAYYIKTGGMVGIRTGYDPMLQVEGAPTNNCDGSSRSVAQMVTYAHKMNLNIAFGSDLNGNIQQVGPRFGAGPCIVAREPNLRKWLDGKDPKDGNVHQGDPPASVSQEFSEKGLAHIGLLPDLLADLKVLKTPGVARLNTSAEAFIQMWERAYDVQLAAVTNEACQEDADCTDGWYCKKGLGALDPNKCARKLADGERCLDGRVCQSGQCDAGVCYTPNSVAMGGACRVDDECKVGRCSALDGITLGKCVCTQDAHCGAGNYCNTGAADIGTNVCKAQLAQWAICTQDHQCQAGRCKSGLCSAPASVAMGDSCRFDDECRVGTCSAPVGGATKGTCVCKEDANCGAGWWCDAGIDAKTNRCRRKLDTGEECGPAGINIGHRCKSGSCKFNGLKHICQ